MILRVRTLTNSAGEDTRRYSETKNRGEFSRRGFVLNRFQRLVVAFVQMFGFRLGGRGLAIDVVARPLQVVHPLASSKGRITR